MKSVFSILFPLEGIFDIDAGDGVGGGGDHLGPQQSQQITQIKKKVRTTNCAHFWDIFSKNEKYIFGISSCIRNNTQNPINALKNTI